MRTFELTDEDEKKFDAWRKEINKKSADTTAIGGAYTFCFTPTGLGPIITIKHVSGKELTITDSNDW